MCSHCNIYDATAISDGSIKIVVNTCMGLGNTESVYRYQYRVWRYLSASHGSPALYCIYIYNMLYMLYMCPMPCRGSHHQLSERSSVARAGAYYADRV